MSIIGNCIKTGACVHFVEYDQYIVADLFQVGDQGDSIVIKFGPEAFNGQHSFAPSRPVTHTAYVGNDYLDKRSGIAVVKASSIKKV